MNPNKTIKGKRPEFYETPGVDYLMHMVMVLAQELSATRDRLDSIERLSEDGKPATPGNIEAYSPTQLVLEEREARRQKLLENLFSVMDQEAAEISNQDTKERFDTVIEDLAKDG